MKTTCPKCGAEVEVKLIDGHWWGYYQERELNPTEKKVEARLGIPFRHFEVHKCEGIKELVRVNVGYERGEHGK